MIKNRKIDYDYSSRIIKTDKKIIRLTKNENELLKILTDKNIVSYNELCKAVYGCELDNSYKNSIASTVFKLKNKIKDIGYIFSIYGEGYQFIEK